MLCYVIRQSLDTCLDTLGKMKSPIEEYSALLNTSDVMPSRAAKIVAAKMNHRWDKVTFHSVSPSLLQTLATDRAWARFTSDDPATLKQIGAHCLFRAAIHVAKERAATERLTALGMSLISEVVNDWLRERT